MAAVDYTNAVNPTPSVRFQYGDSFPRLAAMTDGQGITHYRYGKAGQLGATHLKAIEDPAAYTQLAYQYDALGRLASRQVGGSTESFHYDKLGRLVGDKNALGNFTNDYLGDSHQLTRQKAKGVPYQVVYQYENNLNDRRLKAIFNQTIHTTQPQWPWPLNIILPQSAPVTHHDPVADYHFTTNAKGLITQRQVTGLSHSSHHHPKFSTLKPKN